MARAGILSGWTTNLIRAGRVERGERVLVLVDEPLRREGEELAAAVRDAGGSARVELWTGAERPLEHAPPAVLEGAQGATRPRRRRLQGFPHGADLRGRIRALRATNGVR